MVVLGGDLSESDGAVGARARQLRPVRRPRYPVDASSRLFRYRVWSSGFGVWGLGFRVWSLGFKVEGLEVGVEG